MQKDILDRKKIIQLFVYAPCEALEANYEVIDSLNVFPVPDGDTGSNMLATVKNIRSGLEGNKIEDLAELCNYLSEQALMGSRGNSGLILAQFYAGLGAAARQHPKCDFEFLNSAFSNAAKAALKVLPNPEQGTLLTVMQEVAKKSNEILGKVVNLQDFMEILAEHALEITKKTPSMLPILEEAGVVDAGGFGFAVILYGAVEYLKNRPANVVVKLDKYSKIIDLSKLQNPEGENWGFCSNILIRFYEGGAETLKSTLQSRVKSLVVAEAGEVLKIHFHSKEPGEIVSLLVVKGIVEKIDIQNMEIQASAMAKRDLTHVTENDKIEFLKELPFKTSIVAIVDSSVLGKMVRNISIGACSIVIGGNTNNPSVAEILKCIESAPTNEVLVTPNSKNIITTAQVALDKSSKTGHVLNSHSSAKVLGLLADFNPHLNLEQNLETINELDIRDGTVFTASRDSGVNGVKIRKNDYVLVFENKILATSANAEKLITDLIKQQNKYEMITIYHNLDMPKQKIETLWSILPVNKTEIHNGGINNYEYIFCIEY